VASQGNKGERQKRRHRPLYGFCTCKGRVFPVHAGCSGSEIPIILTTALHRVEWLKNLLKQWLGGWVCLQSRPRYYLGKRNVFPYQDANPGPSSPQPSRYATTDPFSTSITSSKHINKIAQLNMGTAGVPYTERCKAGLAVRHPEFAHRTWWTVPCIPSLLNSNKNY